MAPSEAIRCTSRPQLRDRGIRPGRSNRCDGLYLINLLTGADRNLI